MFVSSIETNWGQPKIYNLLKIFGFKFRVRKRRKYKKLFLGITRSTMNIFRLFIYIKINSWKLLSKGLENFLSRDEECIRRS